MKKVKVDWIKVKVWVKTESFNRLCCCCSVSKLCPTLCHPMDCTTALSNSMTLSHAMWGHQDRWVMVERSDRMWSTGKGNCKPLQYSCLENPMNSMKRQNDRILKEELPRSVGAQYVTGDQWRNNSRKNEGMEAKQKQYPVVDVIGDGSKV